MLKGTFYNENNIQSGPFNGGCHPHLPRVTPTMTERENQAGPIRQVNSYLSGYLLTRELSTMEINYKRFLWPTATIHLLVFGQRLTRLVCPCIPIIHIHHRRIAPETTKSYNQHTLPNCYETNCSKQILCHNNEKLFCYEQFKEIVLRIQTD